MGVEVFYYGAAGGPVGDYLGGEVQAGAAGAGPVGGGGVAAVGAGHDEVGQVAAGEFAGCEGAAGGAWVQAVYAVYSPALVVQVVRDEVPPACPDDEVVGLEAVWGGEVGLIKGDAGAVGA